MADTPKDDEAKFNETLKRMLDTKPKPQKPKPSEANDGDKPDGRRKPR